MLNFADIQINVIKGIESSYQAIIIIDMSKLPQLYSFLNRLIKLRITSADDYLQGKATSIIINLAFSTDIITWMAGGKKPLSRLVFFIVGSNDLKSIMDFSEQVVDPVNKNAIVFKEIGTAHQLRGREHFGFLDAISQPRLKGVHDSVLKSQTTPENEMIWPGEFVFGYPTQNESTTANPGPPRFYGAPWTKDGSLVAFLQIQQDVLAFNNFIQSTSRELSTKYNTTSDFSPDWVASMLMGRRRDGTLLDQTESEQDLTKRCPFSAHVRKSFPRNDIPFSKAQAHRIVRRGVPYGDPNDPNSEKGLLFLSYQTSFEQQFEYVYRNFLANPLFPFPDSGEDPITHGLNNKKFVSLSFQIKSTDGQLRDVELKVPSFIRLKMGGYFFAPSVSSTRLIAQRLIDG